MITSTKEERTYLALPNSCADCKHGNCFSEECRLVQIEADEWKKKVQKRGKR